jgi:hypothetical protein
MRQKISDKQFQIQFDQANRDFLTNVALYTLTSLWSVSAFLISVFSVVYSLNGVSVYTMVVAAVFVVIGAIYWFKALPRARRSLKNARMVNNQLQQRLFELYPECKNKSR